MYSHILVPLDNSPADQTILDHVRSLARMAGSRLTLLHVADGFVARNQERLNLGDSPEMIGDRQYLDRRMAELTGEGFTVDVVLLCGEPASHIIDIAAQRGCDLIAMATHGHRFLADMVLGSVADDVRHRTDIPVLLIRAKRVG